MTAVLSVSKNPRRVTHEGHEPKEDGPLHRTNRETHKTIMQTFLYDPQLAREITSDELKDKKDELDRWKAACHQLEKERDAMESRMRDSDAECQRKIKALEWASVVQSTEYEDRIADLEQLLEEERVAHQQEQQRHARLAQQASDEAEAAIFAAEKRSIKNYALADARAQDAEERAQIARRRAQEEVSLSRAREEDRARQTRIDADAKVRECEEQKNFELSQLSSHTIDRQRAFENTLFANGRPKGECVKEARRQAAALENGMLELLISQEVDCRERRPLEMQTPLLQQQSEVTISPNRSQQLFELGRALHSRTLDRAVGQAVERSLPASLPSRCGALAAGSPLARAGGVWVKD